MPASIASPASSAQPASAERATLARCASRSALSSASWACGPPSALLGPPVRRRPRRVVTRAPTAATRAAAATACAWPTRWRPERSSTSAWTRERPRPPASRSCSPPLATTTSPRGRTRRTIACTPARAAPRAWSTSPPRRRRRTSRTERASTGSCGGRATRSWWRPSTPWATPRCQTRSTPRPAARCAWTTAPASSLPQAGRSWPRARSTSCAWLAVTRWTPTSPWTTPTA